MRADTRQSGAIIIYLVLALVAMGSLTLALSNLSSTSTATEVELNQLNNARCLSESGLLYAKGVIASYQKQSKSISEVVTALNSGPFTITGVGSFTLQASASGNNVVVSSTGATRSGLARYATPSTFSIAYAPKTTNPKLQGLFTQGQSTISGTFSGNLSTQSLILNSGAIIKGSLNVYAQSASCLDITAGEVIGTAGTSSYLCSNSCVMVDNGGIVNGNLYSAGSVTVSSTVNGDIYAGGDVYLGWGAVVNGNIYTSGKFSQQAGYTGFKGTVTTGYTKPAACATYTLPSHETVSSNKKLNITNTYTFTGVANIADHSYAFASINSACGTKICMDLSTPGTYINIFNAGDMTINGDLYVRTSTSTNCFDDANKVMSVQFAGAQAASRVYMDVKGAVTFNGGSSWFGTIYAGGDINPGGGGAYIGGYYTNKSFDPVYASGVSTLFVASDYVTKNWP